jgi:hypothetical protein
MKYVGELENFVDRVAQKPLSFRVANSMQLHGLPEQFHLSDLPWITWKKITSPSNAWDIES